MSIFKSLKEVFRKDPQTGNPYGLTDAQMRTLRRLQSDEDFQEYQRILDRVVILMSEALIASSDSYTDSALKNQIVGIRKAGTLVDEVILRADTKEQHEQRRRQDADERSAARRRLALFGTPAWRRDPADWL